MTLFLFTFLLVAQNRLPFLWDSHANFHGIPMGISILMHTSTWQLNTLWNSVSADIRRTIDFTS